MNEGQEGDCPVEYCKFSVDSNTVMTLNVVPTLSSKLAPCQTSVFSVGIFCWYIAHTILWQSCLYGNSTVQILLHHCGNSSVKLTQYHCCRCPGPFRSQVILSNDIDSVKWEFFLEWFLPALSTLHGCGFLLSDRESYQPSLTWPILVTDFTSYTQQHPMGRSLTPFSLYRPSLRH